MVEHEDLLRNSYAAFNARDIATALKALAPDVEWQDQLEGVTLHGPEAVAEYWRRQWAVMDPSFELKNFALDPNGHMVITLVQTIRGKDGEPISQGLVRHVYEFEKGLVHRMRIL
ncbi:MAG: nuclear transport factor 2 family protein [Flavobacteriales bacterium]|jgi:ketosteroid isomerase-like protein|nr:nuclear transport factor 2 family protein [Flavobacteriales bacterium]MCB0757092.1 nuclear transport factor 2 family protein [Flavobacteriales bacterium]